MQQNHVFGHFFCALAKSYFIHKMYFIYGKKLYKTD